MTEPVLLEERDDGIVVLTLNRPDARNALSLALRRALTDRFTALRQDPSVGVVVLTGAGKAFCAGLDLKELGGASRQPADPGGAVTSGANLIGAMHGFDRPIIGAINGFAITGGFEVALACDILIGSTQARFADTHARVGILPGWGLSQKLPRLVGIQRAKLLSLTGNFLEASDAEHWGLLAEVVEPERLRPRALEIARDVLSCDPETMRGYLRLIDEGFATTFGDGLHLEAKASTAHARNVSSADIAGRRAAIQERGRSQSGGDA